MSNNRGIFAGILGLCTAAFGLARELVAVWRESEPEPRKADRTDLDALGKAVTNDGKR